MGFSKPVIGNQVGRFFPSSVPCLAIFEITVPTAQLSGRGRDFEIRDWKKGLETLHKPRSWPCWLPRTPSPPPAAQLGGRAVISKLVGLGTGLGETFPMAFLVLWALNAMCIAQLGNTRGNF